MRETVRQPRKVQRPAKRRLRSSFKTKWRKKGEKLLKLFGQAMLLTLFGTALYYFVGSDGYFRCRSLTISGLKMLEREKVVQALPPILGKNLALLPLGRIQKRLEAIKLTEKAAVSRVFPDELKITVTERTPLAVAVVGGESWAVDCEGVVLYPFQSSLLDDPIFITGLTEDDEENGAKIKWAVRLINRLNAIAPTTTVSEINVADLEAIKLYAFAQGTEVRLDRSCYQKPKWDFLISFLQERSFVPEKLAYLDLRYSDVVIRPL